MGKQISLEIMAPGKWNGLQFSIERLKKIAENFANLSSIHSVPLKIGHDDDQISSTKSGEQHALGWVQEVWVTAAGKLMAKLTDVPEVVYNAVMKKLYRKVSVELDMGVEHKGKNLGDVLSGVALLGADIPAVNTIEDLQAFLSAQSGTIAGAVRTTFTTIETGYESDQERYEMPKELEELQAQVAKLSAQIVDLSTKSASSAAEIAKLQAEKAELERKEEERDKAEKAAKVSLARDAVTKTLEDAVKAQVITPAQRESFSKIFNIDSDEAVMSLDIETVKSAIGAGKKFSVNTESAHGNGATQMDEETGDVYDRVDEAVRQLMAKENVQDYGVAMERVFSRNRKLATEYVNSNGEYDTSATRRTHNGGA